MMSKKKLYFNGVTPKGKYVTPPASFDQIVERLKREGWKAPAEWVLRWTEDHAVDDPRRKPVLEVEHPWDLAETGWAVVFAPDLDPRVRSALGELLEHRRRQATRDHSHYYRELTYQGEATYKFVERHGGNPRMMADPDHLPYYVLLVGSPESLPYKFQEELDVNHAVGRICFQDLTHYANYARSVVQAEDRPRPRPRQAVFFGTEHANDPATRQTAQRLIRKLAESIREPGMRWDVREVLGADATKEQLRRLLGGAETPALLFAACHGLGFHEEDDRQEDCQGALVCQDWPGPEDEEGVDPDHWFAASDVPDSASLHGLVAFFYACYGAGTPHRDNFDQRTFGEARPIAPGPLVSRLPQRLLSQRNGALAVIGHVDRAWTATFEGSPKNEGLGAFHYGMRRLLQGHTVGWAMEYINQSHASLASMLGSLEEDWRYGREIDEDLFADLWLLRNDARNFVVFGDPAVRLPGAEEPR